MNDFEEQSVSDESFAEEYDSDAEVSNWYSRFLSKPRIDFDIELVFVLLPVQLQEAYARGDLKPGLNVEVTDDGKRKAINNVVSSIFP